jgi:hypothetical protein
MREEAFVPDDDEGGESKYEGEGVRLEDFFAYMPQHSYIFAPSRELWPAASVNARIPPVTGPNGETKASAWLDANAAVEQMTWCPGKPMVIKDHLVSDGGWIERPGCSIFNMYRPPTHMPRTDDGAVAKSPTQSLPRRGQSYQEMAGTPRAATAREDPTTRSCSAANPGSAKTQSSNPSSTPSARGILPI